MRSARLPEDERQSRAAARITGSLAATTASVASGIAVSIEGVGVLAGGALAGGVAVAAAIPMAAAVVLGFGACASRMALESHPRAQTPAPAPCMRVPCAPHTLAVRAGRRRHP